MVGKVLFVEWDQWPALVLEVAVWEEASREEGKTALETGAEACLMRATYERYGERCWERVTRAERADEGKGNKSPPTWQDCLVKYR